MPPKRAPSQDPGKAQRLKDYLGASGVSYKTGGSSYVLNCPRCQKKDKVYVYKDDGRFVCFYCAEINGYRGKPEFLFADILGEPVAKVRLDLWGLQTPTAELFFDFKLENWWSDDDTFDDVPDMDEMATMFWGPDSLPIDSPAASRGRDYLLGRGIDAELAGRYGIRYSGVQQRILFPVSYRDRLFGWQARIIGPSECVDPDTGKTKTIPKVLTVKGLKKDRVLMFADQLQGSSQVIVCEGPVDALKLDLCRAPGEPRAGNVATMGKAVSQAQVNLIRYSGAQRVYLALDPDACQETERLARELSQTQSVYLLEVPKPYKDFGEMSVEACREVYAAARPVLPGRVYVHLKDPEVFARCRR